MAMVDYSFQTKENKNWAKEKKLISTGIQA